MQQFPSFSIITIVFKKEKEIQYFLDALLNQNYAGKWEVIIFDDKSPDNSFNVAHSFKPMYEKRGIGLTIVSNENNLGQCVCRNEGVKLATGDIITIIDADCIMDRTYLAHIAATFMKNDCDVTIGPLNIESNTEDVNIVIQRCKELKTVREKAIMQDSVNRRSFVNCVTRNFSILKSFIIEDLFDVDFSYTASTLGYG